MGTLNGGHLFLLGCEIHGIPLQFYTATKHLSILVSQSAKQDAASSDYLWQDFAS